MNPSIPSRRISGIAPARRARTGVPQASASITTRPNGSGQEDGTIWESPLAKAVTACPRRWSSRTTSATIRSVPP